MFRKVFRIAAHLRGSGGTDRSRIRQGVSSDVGAADHHGEEREGAVMIPFVAPPVRIPGEVGHRRRANTAPREDRRIPGDVPGIGPTESDR